LHNIQVATNVYKNRQGRPRRRREAGADGRDVAKPPLFETMNQGGYRVKQSQKAVAGRQLKKQSQLGGAVPQRGRAGGAWGDGPASLSREPVMRNEPNLSRVERQRHELPGGPQVLPPGDKSAKQTQFASGRHERQVPCGAEVMTDRTCNGPRKNKANLAAAPGNGRGGRVAPGATAPNKPNFPEAERKGKSLVEKDLW
jgi:hypothetical protein